MDWGSVFCPLPSKTVTQHVGCQNKLASHDSHRMTRITWLASHDSHHMTLITSESAGTSCASVSIMEALLIVKLFLALGVVHASLKPNQSEPCRLSCAVADSARQQMTFKAKVGDGKARIVNMTVSSQVQQTEGDACPTVSPNGLSTEPYYVWAASTKEPYLYAPPDFLRLAQRFSLHYERMDIHVRCTMQKTRQRDNKTMPAFPEVVMESLMYGLMETTGGTLCFSFTESYDNYSDTFTVSSYKCCQLVPLTPKPACEVVHPSDGWFQALSDLWEVISFLVLTYCIPAVICLFPVWPRTSRDGVRCIVLEDPSPAGFTTFLVKLSVHEDGNSLLNKASVILLRACLPCMTVGFPIVLLQVLFKTPDLHIPVMLTFLPAIILAALSSSSGKVRRRQCHLCSAVFGKVVHHFHVNDAVKAHMTANLSGAVFLSQTCAKLSDKLLKRMCSCLSFHSPLHAAFSIIQMGFLIPLGAIFLFLFCFAACIMSSFLILFLFSPISSIAMHESFSITHFLRSQRCCRQYIAEVPNLVMCLFCSLFYVYMLGLILVYRYFGTLPAYLFLILTDNVDAVLPVLAFILPIVHYLYRCFTSFSEKYQLLKIQLYLEIQNYLSREGNGNESSLLLYTESDAVAIPEELFEIACQELEMPMLRSFSAVLYPMVGVVVFYVSVLASIMVCGASSGISPLMRIISIFFVSSIPTILQLFPSGKSDKKLKEIRDELRLKNVVARYAERGPRDDDIDRDSDRGAGAGEAVLGEGTGARYGSTPVQLWIQGGGIVTRQN